MSFLSSTNLDTYTLHKLLSAANTASFTAEHYITAILSSYSAGFQHKTYIVDKKQEVFPIFSPPVNNKTG